MIELGRVLTDVDDPLSTCSSYRPRIPLPPTPNQLTVRRGLGRADLFTVVLENFLTDTTDYADIVLPSTMQIEDAELHDSFGHLHINWNEPAVPPRGECLPHTEIFRRLATALGVTEPAVYASDDDLARDLLGGGHPALAGTGRLR